MKFYKISLTLLTCLILGCSQNKKEKTPTIEDKINDKFIEYVNNNFDDPAELKEIISISPSDTMSKESIGEIIELLNNLDSLSLQMDSMCTANLNSLSNNLTPAIQEKYYGNERVLSLLEKAMDDAEDYCIWLEYNGHRYDYLNSEIDRLFNDIDSTLFQVTYDIKTRVNTNDGLKIQHFYAIVENADIEIYNSTPGFEEYSEGIGKLFKYIEEYSELTNKKFSFKEESLKTSEIILKTLELK